MAKIFNSRVIMLIVATILVIALLVACVLVGIKPKSEYAGVLDAEEALKADVVLYSLDTENKFKRDVSDFLENVFASFFDTVEGFDGTRVQISNSSEIALPILNIFSRASIPSDKLLNFSQYLKNMDTDSAVESIWLFFIKIEPQPDGTYKGRFASASELAEIFTSVDFGFAVNDVVKNTALTAEEVGRLLYELIFTFSGVEQREVLSDIGRGSFVNLFVSATTIYETYAEFSLAGGSLSEARMLGELAFEMGAELDELIDGHGVNVLLTALWLDGGSAIDDTKLQEFLASAGVDSSTLADVNEVNTALTAGIQLAEFAIYFARTALLEVGNAPFEYLAIYYANERENAQQYLYLHQITLSRAIAKGIRAGIDEGSLINDYDTLVENLANFKLTVEDVEMDIADPSARLAELKADFKQYLDVIFALDENYKGVDDVADVGQLSGDAKAELMEYSAFLLDFNYNEMTVGVDSLTSSLLINVIFNVMSQAVEEALGGVA